MNLPKSLLLSFISALLLALSAWISIPIGPVPITMQLTAVFLIGILLPMQYAALSVALYLILGILGVPLFAEGRSGYSVIVGPTGGYLIGFLIGVIVISYLTKEVRYNFLNDKPVRNHLSIMWSCLIGAIVILSSGALWGKISTGLPWNEIFNYWLLPFLPGLLIKMAIAVLVAIQILKTKITLH